MRLIALSENGTPKEPAPPLPKEAEAVGAAYVSLYAAVGYEPPWLGYLAVEAGVCVGSCGFKGPPANGRVEIAYYTFPEFEGRGIATQMATALLRVARCGEQRILIAAQTLPHESASTRILQKLDFRRVATLEHPEDGTVWEWHWAGSSGQ